MRMLTKQIHGAWWWAGLAGLGLAWLMISWKRWPDCIVFGQQVYVPWQMSLGKSLYSDIDYAWGPLAQTVHGVLFKAFGPSITLLMVCGFMALLGISVALYYVFKAYRNAFSGFAAVCILWGIFAFGRYSTVGSFNFINPYSYELVYGLFLSLLGLLGLKAWAKNFEFKYLMLIAGILGLTALTRAEIFWAYLGTLVMVALLKASAGNYDLRRTAGPALCFGVIAALPTVLTLFYLGQHVSWSEAWGAVGSWLMNQRDPIAACPSGRHQLLGCGLSLWERCVNIMQVASGYVFAFTLLGILANVISYFKPHRTRAIMVGMAFVLALLVFMFIRPVHIYQALRAVPVVAGGILLYKLFVFLKRPGSNSSKVKDVFQIGVITFSLLVSASIWGKFHPFQAGFVLALPATICAALFVINDIPAMGRWDLFAPRICRTLFLIFLLGVLILHLRWSASYYDRMTYPIAQGKDAFWAEDQKLTTRPFILDQAVQWFQKHLTPQDTVLILPDGAMAHYLILTSSPVPTTRFDQDAVSASNEQKLLGRLQEARPTYVFNLEPGLLGYQYGQSLVRWALQHYQKHHLWFLEVNKDKGDQKKLLAIIMKKIE